MGTTEYKLILTYKSRLLLLVPPSCGPHIEVKIRLVLSYNMMMKKKRTFEMSEGLFQRIMKCMHLLLELVPRYPKGHGVNISMVPPLIIIDNK